MECILIGTGGMMPMSYRMLTSLAVRLNGQLYLFDAGEGTQINWKRARLGVRGLKLIAVTHLHADHCLGIPGMIMLRAQMENPDPLTILGPPGTREFITQSQRTLEFQVNFPIHIIEWPSDNSGLAYQDGQARILWQPVKHTRFCLGYRFEELDRPGKFNPARARAMGVPMGPLWGKLQSGESVNTPSQKTVQPSQVLGPARRGRHIAFAVDTRPAPGVYSLCRKADLAFLEGMFLTEHSEHADVKGHMTVAEAARIARKSGAAKAVLVHISPRYENSELGKLEDEARKEFNSVKIGRDLDVFAVSLPEKTGPQ
ncbi:MAG: ribonuclease Z [Syntrophobacteraceae bacterium]